MTGATSTSILRGPTPSAGRPPGWRAGWHDVWRAFRAPVSAEARRDLAAAWDRLDPGLRVEHQTIGLMEEGCGATIGAMPRCDFGCRGCYLGSNANSTPAASVGEIKAQMQILRTRLGPWGNLQLTDGEVTLRPASDLVELLRYAEEIELIPMMMTHGETFRRRPGLLERLVVEGGLAELSIHIDTTQRGRDEPYADAASERKLMPLRDEFADLVRAVRRTTGRPLRVASTVTVTRDNLAEVPAMVQWFRANVDAFRIVSFQPAAQVGRTRSGFGGGVTQDDVWVQVTRGVLGDDATPDGAETLLAERWWFGHPSCSRMLPGVVCAQPGVPNRWEPVSPNVHDPYRDAIGRFFRGWGGISFRQGSRFVHVARLLGMVRQDPGFFLGPLPRFAWFLLGRLDPGHRGRLLWRLATGRARLHPLTIGSHAFMSPEELETPEGEERLRNCIFTVPIDGALVPMCSVNATGIRDAYYDDLAAAASAATAAPGASRPVVELTVGTS